MTNLWKGGPGWQGLEINSINIGKFGGPTFEWYVVGCVEASDPKVLDEERFFAVCWVVNALNKKLYDGVDPKTLCGDVLSGW